MEPILIALLLLIGFTGLMILIASLRTRIECLERELAFLHEFAVMRYENLPVSGDFSEIGLDQNGKPIVRDDED